MRRRWNAFVQFLTAEEIPRWFGLSVILIYLVGLGSVANFGITQARREGAAFIQRTGSYAVRLLAERLGERSDTERRAAMYSPDAGLCAPLAATYQRMLRDFASEVPTRSLRIIDAGGIVVASMNDHEVGTEAAAAPNVDRSVRIISALPHLEIRSLRVPGHALPDTFVRARFTVAAGGHATSVGNAAPADSEKTETIPAGDELPPGDTETPSGGAEILSSARDSDTETGGESNRAATTLFVEAILPPRPMGVSNLADHAFTLAVVLVVLGALFVVYRCLREQMRSVSRIADRLRAHRERLGQELEGLRIGGALDQVSQAWNELIDLTQEAVETVQRTEANDELSRALQSTKAGALAGALSAIPDGIMYIAAEGRFEFINSAACRLLGWQPQNPGAAALHDAQASGVGARILELIRTSQRPDGSFESQTELIEPADPNASDQSSYRLRITPLQQTRHPGECVVVIRDVSQQVRADRAREEFITHVTHELRTPLTNIRAYADTLSSGMFEDPSLITECYNVITKETRRLSRLIEDILSVSQLEVGSIELALEDVDLKMLLSEGVRDVRGLADEKNIDVQLILPAKMPMIRADRDKLAVVINNLLGNAIKYTPADGHVIVGCQCGPGEIVLTFKDDGIGIDPADHARVFEKFQRADDPNVEAITGTGIGLYTAREIVRRHHGEIELVSEKGSGTTFLVRLPNQESRAAAFNAAEEA